MKRIITIAAAAVLFLGLTGGAFAFPGLSMDAAVNVPSPTGDFADGAKTGFGGAIEAFAGLPMVPFKFGGRVAYNRFGHEVGDGNTSILEIQPSVRYGLGLPLGLLSLFGQFGVGVYNWKTEGTSDESGTDFGLSVGIGANVMNCFVLPMYNVIFNDTEISYFSINVGMNF